MPIKLELRENDRVLYYEVTDPWNMNDLRTLYDENKAIRDQHNYTIHAIVNVIKARNIPQNLLNARTYSPDAMHPRAGYIILVGAHSLLQMIAEVASRVMHSDKFRFFETEEEAWTFIRHVIDTESR